MYYENIFKIIWKSNQ